MGCTPSKSTTVVESPEKFQSHYDKLHESMRWLRQTQVFDYEARDHIYALYKMYYKISDDKDAVSKTGEILVEEKILEVFVKLWDECHEYQDLFYNETETIEFDCMKFLMGVLWNYSDECKKLAQEFYKDEIAIERIMRAFSIPQLAVSKLERSEIRDMMEANLSILGNVLRLENRNRDHIRKEDGLEMILPYANSSDDIIKVDAFTVLAYCVNEKENSKIMADSGLIAFIIKILDTAITSSNHVSEKYAYAAEEVVRTLTKLASNEENKKSIVEEGVLPLLSKLLHDKSSSAAERLQCINCLWSLAFYEDNKKKILQASGLIDYIKSLRKDKGISKEMKKAIESLMFVLELEQPVENHKGGQKHVMLSYNWEVQPVMLKLKKYLSSQGINIWMDVDRIHGSILDAMSEAIENSALIVIAMTESYKNSLSCRTEAHYAYSRNVPVLPLLLQTGYKADGWLGVLLGMELYVDLSAGDFDRRFPDVLKEIQKRATGAARKDSQTDGPVPNDTPIPTKSLTRRLTEPEGNTIISQDIAKIKESLEKISAIIQEESGLRKEGLQLRNRYLQLKIEKLKSS